MVKEFKAFIMRGNVVDLAVGVIIGAAFKDVVNSLVANIFTPIIGLVGGRDFSNLTWRLHGDAVLRYGQFITDVISFVLIAVAVFFFVVKPLNVLAERRKRGQEADPVERSDEANILVEIRDLLSTRQN
ncbi:MAG TPA: large conductance mechanosensitive channel protein MscL [Acidimicrobiales bacterium]|jgi:large conductance mechanosensitive channel